MLSKTLSLVLCGLTTFSLAFSGSASRSEDGEALLKHLSASAFESAGSVDEVVIRRDVATLTLLSGRVGLARPPEMGSKRVFAAAFRGKGILRFSPTLDMEQQQLTRYTGASQLEAEFSEAVFIFSDGTGRELREQIDSGTGDGAEFQKLYRERTLKLAHLGLDWRARICKSELSDNPEWQSIFVAELKTRKRGWLTLIFDEADPEQVELSRLDVGRKIRDIWVKFPAKGRTPQKVFADPLSHQEFLPESYRLDVTIEKNTELKGIADVTLKMKREGERVLILSLDPTLRVGSVSWDGKDLPYFQPEDPGDSFFLGSYLSIISPEPFPKGAVRLRIAYAGKRVVQKVGTGNYFCRSFGWYPTYGLGRPSLSVNAFAGRSDFDITLRVPKQNQVVAVGSKIEEKTDKKYRITRWKTEVPMTVAGFAFGQYKIQEAKVGDTEVRIYANKHPDDALRAIERAAGEANQALGLLSPSQMRKVMAVEVSNMLRVMGNYFGPYPYKKLAVTNIPYSYGQGWPSLLYLSALSFMDSTQRHQLGITDHTQITDFFRAHETSHQWWGHVVSWKSYHDQWLSEGFAEFSGYLYTLFRQNQGTYNNQLRKSHDAILRKSRSKRYSDLGPIYAGLRLSSGKHPGGYSTIVYKKGGWVLHMIRMMMLDPRSKDSDARFKALMQDFTRTYHNRAASTEDFKNMVAKHMTPIMDVDGTRTMDWFFDSWVYGTGIPRYRLEYKVESAAQQGSYLLSGTLYQSEVPGNFRMIVPLYLHQGKRGMRLGWITARGAESPFSITLGFRPDTVSINDNKDVLAR